MHCQNNFSVCFQWGVFSVPCYCWFQSARAAITKYRRLDDLNKRNVFLTVLEAWKSKIKMLARRDSSWGLSPRPLGDCHIAVSSPECFVLVTVERDTLQALWCLLQATNSTMRAPPPWPPSPCSHLPKAHLRTPSQWRLGFHTWHLRGTRAFSPHRCWPWLADCPMKV